MLKIFIIQGKKLLIDLTIIEELDLKLFMRQIKNNIEQDLKY